jgi:hypothetical protein
MIDLQQFVRFIQSGGAAYDGYAYGYGREQRGQAIYEIRIHPEDFETLREQLARAYGGMPMYQHDPYGRQDTYRQIMGQNFQIDNNIAIGSIGVFFRPPQQIELSGPTEKPKEPPVSMKEVCDSMIQTLTEETKDMNYLKTTVADVQPIRGRMPNDEERVF